MEDLGVSNCEPMRLYWDNKAIINIAHNPILHDRTKHVETNRHFIKEKLNDRLICMSFVTSKE